MNDPFPSAFRFIVADELRSAIAGPNRTFDGRGQAGIRPIAGERQIAPGRVRAGASFILRGSRGSELTLEDAQSVVGCWKNATVIDVEGDYALQMENPAGLAEALIKWSA